MNEQRDLIAEMRREKMETVESLAQKRFDDTRWDWLRPIARRRSLVLAWAVTVVAGAISVSFDNPVVTLVALIIGGALVWLLRIVVRTVVDLPSEVLDERLESERNRTYREAYTMLTSVTLFVLVAMYIAWDAEAIEWEATPADLNAIFFGVLFGGLGLPSAIYAWRQREV